ncbi:guanosine diphosphatase [Sarocladium strictum]
MRRQSVSLPTKQVARDPHEKPDRYDIDDKSPFGKMKEAFMSQSQRTRWLKTAAIVFSVVFFVYWFSPSGVEIYNEVSHKGGESSAHANNNGQSPADDSYGTDKCTKSFSKDKPIVQYVLMIDAGSTGSRVHVYKFNNCGPTPELEGEDFMMNKKEIGGLSSFDTDTQGAAASLDPLLKFAREKVPAKLQGCSPIAVKATAGLRLLGDDKSNAILDAVRKHLEDDSPFPVVSKENNGVVVMEGSEEGVYAWITLNYLLGKIGGLDKSETAAVFDLGGGSTQIVFEPTFKEAANGGMPAKLEEGDHKYELDFGGRKFDLYQHSHLGFGLMSARKSIHAALISDLTEAKKAEQDKSWLSEPITHPCFPPNMSKTIEVEISKDNMKEVKFVGPSEASPAQCRGLAEKILDKGAACTLAPCSFGGVHQPSLAKTFSREDIYIFSYFFERTKELGMPDSFSLREMQDLTQTVCMGKESWDVFAAVPKALEELADRPEWCLDLSFMMALLHTGYEMPVDREVKVVKKINDNEVGWCLGASLPLLASDSGWSCKINQVA